MRSRFSEKIYTGIVAVLLTAGAHPAAAQPTSPDVRFMQGMIHHHAQALEMTGLVADRSTSRDIGLIARRIEISQQDEIAWMRSWLERRGREAPDAHPLMPGMLTHEEMAQLSGATGAEFDRLFLELMIHHHEGALEMVEDLLATEGAAQETELFRFVSDVDADQRAEIRRMRIMLDALTEPAAGE